MRGEWLTPTNLLLAFTAFAFLVDAWYTRKWLRASQRYLKELQDFSLSSLEKSRQISANIAATGADLQAVLDAQAARRAQKGGGE